MDPKEHLIARRILRLHQSGKSNQSIADIFNAKKIPTRKGEQWSRSVVRTIIIREKFETLVQPLNNWPGMDELKIPIYFQGRGQSGKANRQAFGLSSTNHIVRSHGGKLIYRKAILVAQASKFDWGLYDNKTVNFNL